MTIPNSSSPGGGVPVGGGCACGCGQPLPAGRSYATGACRQRAHRNRQAAATPRLQVLTGDGEATTIDRAEEVALLAERLARVAAVAQQRVAELDPKRLDARIAAAEAAADAAQARAALAEAECADLRVLADDAVTAADAAEAAAVAAQTRADTAEAALAAGNAERDRLRAILTRAVDELSDAEERLETQTARAEQLEARLGDEQARWTSFADRFGGVVADVLTSGTDR